MLNRLAAFVALAAGIPLLGASILTPPVVVVYPITATGSVPAGTGGEVALLIAGKLAQLGGIDVRPATPGTERAKFLDAALAGNADYYVTGFLTPLGSDTSLVTQVVSTHTGSIVYSTTAVVRTFGDAVAQSDALHDAILRHAGRGLASLDAPPAPAPSAAPDSAAGVNLTKALRKHKRSAAPATPSAAPASAAPASAASASGTAASAASASGTPAAAASASQARPSAASASGAPASGAPASAAPASGTPAAAAPASGTSAAAASASRTAASVAAAPAPGITALLFAVSGSAEGDQRAYATAALVGALRRAGVAAAALGVGVDGSLAHAGDICRATPGTRALYGAALALGRNDAGRATAQLDLTAYDCNGQTTGTERALTVIDRRGLNAAIDRAAGQAVRASTAAAAPAPAPKAKS